MNVVLVVQLQMYCTYYTVLLFMCVSICVTPNGLWVMWLAFHVGQTFFTSRTPSLSTILIWKMGGAATKRFLACGDEAVVVCMYTLNVHLESTLLLPPKSLVPLQWPSP